MGGLAGVIRGPDWEEGEGPTGGGEVGEEVVGGVGAELYSSGGRLRQAAVILPHRIIKASWLSSASPAGWQVGGRSLAAGNAGKGCREGRMVTSRTNLETEVGDEVCV